VPDAAITPELALRYLDELSTDIRAGVVLDREGSLLASTLADGERAEQLGRLARELFERAERAGGAATDELEASTSDGSVFASRNARFALAVVAGRFALPSLMLYDLRSVLSDLDAQVE
jgi:predicted regulator of Ras-like GTPase activity (Roadblock/LC7/MglB family)